MSEELDAMISYVDDDLGAAYTDALTFAGARKLTAEIKRLRTLSDSQAKTIDGLRDKFLRELQDKQIWVWTNERIRSWILHERVALSRLAAPEGKPCLVCGHPENHPAHEDKGDEGAWHSFVCPPPPSSPLAGKENSDMNYREKARDLTNRLAITGTQEDYDDIIEAALREAAAEAYKNAELAVPSNWLDPILTGPEAVRGLVKKIDCQTVEAIFKRVRVRISALRQGAGKGE